MSSSKRKQIALTSDSMFIVWTRFINLLACDNITPLFGICIFTGSRLEPAKAYGKGPGAVVWPPYPQGAGTDPVARTNLMVAHWGAFANRLLRNYIRKYMTLSMDLSGQLIFMNVPVILMVSQLSQWLLQQVMCTWTFFTASCQD